jgi:hypothetical protein
MPLMALHALLAFALATCAVVAVTAIAKLEERPRDPH